MFYIHDPFYLLSKLRLQGHERFACDAGSHATAAPQCVPQGADRVTGGADGEALQISEQLKKDGALPKKGREKMENMTIHPWI